MRADALSPTICAAFYLDTPADLDLFERQVRDSGGVFEVWDEQQDASLHQVDSRVVTLPETGGVQDVSFRSVGDDDVGSAGSSRDRGLNDSLIFFNAGCSEADSGRPEKPIPTSDVGKSDKKGSQLTRRDKCTE